MIQDKMIGEIQELKRSGYSFPEAYSELRRRHTKVPCEKTVRKYYNMDRAPDDNHAKVRKGMAFDAEPFRDAVIDIVASNPGCLCQAGNEQNGTRNLNSLADAPC